MSNFVQKIDLYAKLEPPKEKPIAIICMAISLCLLVSGYFAAAGFLMYDENSTSELVATEKAQQRTLQAQIDQRLSDDAVIDVFATENRLKELRAQFDQQKQLAQQVRYLSIQGSNGFSEAMAGLARQHVPGIALQKFNFGGQSQTFSLQGQLGNPKALPQYVTNLGKESAFKNFRFQKVEVKTEGQYMLFDLSSSMTNGEDPGT